MVLSRDSAAPLELAYGLIFALVAIGGLIFVIRHRPHGHGIRAAAGGLGNRQNTPPRWSNVPARTFADVGGLDDQKRRISAVVQNRLFPEKFKRHGVVQNGILLYGPRGTGKTFLAEATAGEFKINYWYAKPTSLMERWIGSSDANIREAFARAYAHRPVLFFLTRSIR
jgi:AAA+ superfamily predicted ATPase